MTGDPRNSPPAPDRRRPELDERPPILGSWGNIYLLVLGTLAAVVLCFWVLTSVYG